MSNYSFGSGLPTWNGIPMVGGFPRGLTNCFFVNYGNGQNSGSVKSNSVNRPWKTLEYAETKITTNKNEGIALMGNSTHTLTNMLTVDKNRMHIFGYDPVTRMYGQNAKISLGVTTAATDIAAMLNTGVRNSFTNIKFMSSNTKDESLYSVAEGGEYSAYIGCEIYKSTDLDEPLAAELLCNGDSAVFNNCVIGDLVNEKGDTSDERPCVLLTRETITGKVSRDVEFNDCEFLTKAATTATACVHSTTATDVERRMILRRPIFWNAKLAAADPAAAISLDAAQTQGDILLIDPVSIGITALATASSGVYVVGGSVPADPTTGKAVAVDGS